MRLFPCPAKSSSSSQKHVEQRVYHEHPPHATLNHDRVNPPNKKTIRLAIGIERVGPAQHGNGKRDKKPDESQGTTHPHKDERAA